MRQKPTRSVPSSPPAGPRRGELTILRGDPKSGVENLQVGLEAIHRIGYETLTTEFHSLSLGQKVLGQYDEALALADQMIRRAEINGEHLYLPELLRVKAGILLAMQQRPDEAELCLS